MTTDALRLTEIDGVRTYCSPSHDGQLRAMLQFRVGHADEAMAERGITHLIEHLALFQFGGEVHHNGQTGPNLTAFWTQGEPESVVAFLAGLTSALHGLPTDRIETERAILRAEEAGRGSGLGDELLVWRYGLTGYGASASREFGVGKLSADDLASWSSEFFTQGNAVLSLSGDIPAGLRLHLPRGPKKPPPHCAEPEGFPQWYVSQYRGGAGTTVIRRSPAATAYGSVLERRMRDQLRFESGQSYAPTVYLERRDGDWSYLAFSADALPENASAVASQLVDIVAATAAEGPREDELAEYKRLAATPVNEAAWASGLSALASHSDLLGSRVFWDRQEVLDLNESITLEELAAVAQAAWAASIFAAPEGAINRDGLTRIPDSSPITLSGDFRRPLNPPADKKFGLVAIDEGLMLVDGARNVTVRFDELGVLLMWKDGLRTLVGMDGFQVSVEPNLWPQGQDLVAFIDDHVDSARKIDMGERDASVIPARPSPPMAPPVVAPSKPHGLSPALTSLLIALAAVLILATVATHGATGPLAVALIVYLRRASRNRT